MKELIIGKRISSVSVVEGASGIVRFDFDDGTSLIIEAVAVLDSPVSLRFKYRDSRYPELLKEFDRLKRELERIEKELEKYDDLKL